MLLLLYARLVLRCAVLLPCAGLQALLSRALLLLPPTGDSCPILVVLLPHLLACAWLRSIYLPRQPTVCWFCVLLAVALPLLLLLLLVVMLLLPRWCW
jgi:hypothetical protein